MNVEKRDGDGIARAKKNGEESTKPKRGSNSSSLPITRLTAIKWPVYSLRAAVIRLRQYFVQHKHKQTAKNLFLAPATRQNEQPKNLFATHTHTRSGGKKCLSFRINIEWKPILYKYGMYVMCNVAACLSVLCSVYMIIYMIQFIIVCGARLNFPRCSNDDGRPTAAAGIRKK